MAKNVIIDDLTLESTKESSKKGSFEGNPNKVKTGLTRWWTDQVNVPEYFQILTDITKSLPIQEHKFTSHGTVPCLKSPVFRSNEEQLECPYCLEKDIFDKTSNPKMNRPKNCLVFLTYFYSRVGRTIDIEDENGTKTIEDSPLKMLSIVRGKDDINIQTLIDLDSEGLLTSEVFSIVKHPKEAKKTSVPEISSKAIVSKKFKHLPDGLNIPSEIKDFYDKTSKEQIRGLLLNTYISKSSDKGFNLDWLSVLNYATKPETFASKEGTSLDDEDSLSNSLDR